MKKICVYRRYFQLALLTALVLPELVSAQYFTANTGDLLLGFRKYNPAGSYELVVNAGSVADLLAMPAGTSVTINQLTSAELSRAFAANFNNLHWSVATTVSSFGGWNGFPYETIWFTLPRNTPDSRTSAPGRASGSTQSSVMQSVNSIGNGASLISINVGSTNTDNNAVLVREPAGNANAYSTFVKSGNNPSQGTYNDQWGYNVENVTPASFTSAEVSDLYQSVPTGAKDPTTGTNNGAAYYVGYFTLDPNGTLTFTRASVATAVPPAPKIVSVTRSGDTSTISFTTTNGNFTYTLYYTNSAGLDTSVSNWPALLTTVTGNGLTNSLSDTTAASDRIYRIGVR